MDSFNKYQTKKKCSLHSTKIIVSIFLLLSILLLILLQASPENSIASYASRPFFKTSSDPTISNKINILTSKLRDSVTFLPIKDLRFAKTAMEGNTWFMSSLNDTHEENEAEHLYFPSEASKGRLLCINGHDERDGTKNSYALAWQEALPDSAILMKGLTFVSDTYYDYVNLWHGVCAMAPFVSWSIKNECQRPERWVLFHWGEMRFRMGSWLQLVMEANFGEVNVEKFVSGDGPWCFEKAVVMRHNQGRMGKERKLQVFDLLKCNARRFCGIDPSGTGNKVNERNEPVIRLTLLMRRGSRSFKDATTVTDIFNKECAKVEGCVLKVAQSEDLSFCDQVKVLTDTDVVASPHGAQLTNMLFMDRNSSVMEFFPKGWLELAGVGQYAHHWMADESGMNHRGAWWEPLVKKDCPNPQHDLECFNFYKDGKVGHNETHFADWAATVLKQIRATKLEQLARSSADKRPQSSPCFC